MIPKRTIPKDRCIDNTCKLLMEGYLFIPNRCRRYKTDLFQTRLMGQKVICLSGEDAAEIFYNNHLFTRKGAIPKRIQKTLFGKKAIQTMDGPDHKHRKSMFLSMMTPNRMDRLVKITEKQWLKSAKQWERKDRIILFNEAGKILCRSACQWAGVPIRKSEVTQRAKDFSAMIDAFGAVGPRHWKGRCARNRCEKWMKQIIKDTRCEKIYVPEGTALHDIAFYRDAKGKLLRPKIAGIEIINVLRPITAIATYITFGAVAMHTNPECEKKIQYDEDNYTHMFAQEVRRYYPFGPFLGARVRNDFLYNHQLFRKGTLVFLDLYGTDHDARIWYQPNHFWPERFKYRKGSPYDFIPQGGGNYDTGHRCPGEWITTMLIKVSMSFLANHLKYKVPLQDLGYSLRRMPTLPKSKFIMQKIKLV
ncbi:cytochrome P450 [Mobilitalea sibirica]|uniref:Cytochrome P450 n=1 Tax=Mobilitalea sibirica TaxID=1462919 RepID=A0A8J7KWA3_9FIRM|nr:cytochrome P450 [Mobilitalea sibirica]MBH1940167.1 cytochrome P450 [Mobilitalea sibirica]